MKRLISLFFIGGIIVVVGVVGFMIMKKDASSASPEPVRDPHYEALYNEAVTANTAGDTDNAFAGFQAIVEAQDAPQEIIARSLSELGKIYEEKGQLLKAKDAYKKIVMEHSNVPFISDIQRRLGEVNIAILFSPTITDADVTYVIKPGDTLSEIAKAHKTTVGVIKKANGLSSDLIRVGKELKIPQASFSIVVDKSLNQLVLKKNDEVIKTYIVATGLNNSTPVGEFTIINKLPEPVWYTAGAIVPPESPDNILGTRWLGLSKAGYGIHGTTMPESLGKQVTQGCVRMHNRDVEELYEIVPVGTQVTILD